MIEPVYYKDGRKYKKIGRDEMIEKGAMHSILDGELHAIKSPDTIGDTPSSFSLDRNFFNPIKQKCMGTGDLVKPIDGKNETRECRFCGKVVKLKLAIGGVDDFARYLYMPYHKEK